MGMQHERRQNHGRGHAACSMVMEMQHGGMNMQHDIVYRHKMEDHMVEGQMLHLLFVKD